MEQRTDEQERILVELDESQARTGLVLEAATDGIFEWDIGTGEVYWNDSMYELLGLSSEEITPSFELFSELIHPQDRPRTLHELWTFVEQGEKYEGEYRMRHYSGEYRAVASRAKVLRSEENGAAVRMVGAVTDVTERKKAEERLKRSEASLAAAQRRAHLGSWEWDMATGEVHWSDEHYRIFGYTPQSFTLDYETHYLSAIHPEDREYVQRAINESFEGRPYSIGYRIVRSDGETRYVHSEGEALFDEDGREPVGMTGTVQDITDRKRIEEVLRENEQRFRQIFEHSVDAIFVHDEKGRIADCNKEACKSLGYTREELLSLNIRDFASGLLTEEESRKRERSGGTLWQRIVGGDTGTDHGVHVGEHQRKDGTTFPVEARLGSVEYGGRRLVLASARDITERKRYERELEEARTAAEEANRIKSAFLANMSHEIRTPMNGVIGMTGLLLDTDLDEEQREFAETVRTSGESLLTIINDILDFSKIEAGRLDLETIDFDLRNTVERTLELVSGKAHEKGLELINLIDYDVPDALRGDPGRISQVLTNLIGNAIKFSDEGEVLLKVSLVEEDAEEQPSRVTVRFEITDTGIGLTQEEQQRLFRAFSQADASTTRRYGGTGLGLAISRQLVEMMGGEMGLQSEKGVGSTFWFSVPFEKQPEGVRPLPKPRPHLRGLRVLVVDDNATNREILHQQVLSWEMESGTAADGQQGLEALKEAARKGEHYDVAILDMHMPRMDGLELTRKIKADPEISGTRLILLTSAGEHGQAARAKEIGIAAYLIKPTRQSQIYDAIAAVMGIPEDEEQQEAGHITRHTLREQRVQFRARILLAEDNPVNQKVAARMLEKLGYRVDVAANGKEAVEALSRVPYSAMLMDLQMPEMDGYEATAEIRKLESVQENRITERGGLSDPHIPIIALTASAMKGDREKALEAGIDDYITKPVKAEMLEEVLQRWLEPPQEESRSEQSASAAEQRQEAPLDPAVIAGLQELGDQELLTELVQIFLEDAPAKINSLRQAIAESEAHSVEGEAHSLKGSSCSMGAKKMADTCAELQATGASGDLTQAVRLLERLEEEFDRVRAALKSEVKAE